LDLEKHYENSKSDYEELKIQGAESHMMYYKEKYYNHYLILKAMSNLKEFIKATEENNGATYNLKTGELNPTKGYFVGLKDKGRQVKYHYPFNEVVQDFVLKNSFDLSNENTFVGSWIEDGELYLDVVKMFEDKEDGINAGIENEQIAIYDASTNEVITL
jgi:hypothetical protein